MKREQNYKQTMQYLLLMSLYCFFGSSYTTPFKVPYRNPTPDEIKSNLDILISSTPISESDIIIEKKTLQYLVDHNYLDVKYLHRWTKLAQLMVIKPRQSVRMVRIKKKKARSLKRLQRDNGLIATGILDNATKRIIFPETCGTPDYIDEPFDDDFGDYDDIGKNINKKKREVQPYT
jgi:hypothetical protein